LRVDHAVGKASVAFEKHVVERLVQGFGFEVEEWFEDFAFGVYRDQGVCASKVEVMEFW
jgi:hypothetical protein